MSGAQKPPVQVSLLPFQKEAVAQNQQSVPLPYMAGTRLMAVRWISPALNEITKDAPSSGGGKGGKGGSKNKSKNYYGTLAGATCWGPLDWLTAIIHNGGYLWQGSLTITTEITDLTGSLSDPALVGSGGYLKLYRGTETQSADSALPGHPGYHGTVVLVGKNLFFGQDSGTAPNIQLIGGRLPRVSTAICAAADNVADDGQVNPIAALAEILLDERGAGLSVGDFDAASWLYAAHWAYLNKDFCFCSPLIDTQMSGRDFVKRMMDPSSGFIRCGIDGKLTCKIYEWGIDPGSLPVLDAQAWTRKPKFSLGDWVDIPTEYLVTFTDRAYEYQNNAVLVPNARASQIRQVEDQHRLDRPDVVRATQAHRHATETARRLGTAPSSAKISVRGPFFRNLLPGDKVRVDTDPEPGGSGLSQMCRIKSIEQDRHDEAKISVVTDNLLPANVYQPSYTMPTLATDTSPPMQYFLAVPLPPLTFGFPPAVAILATRPSAAVIGMDVYFSDSHTNPFDDLGRQVGFAVRCQLAATITSGATTIQLTELDGLSGFDADISANTPGGNATSAKNNTLLILLASLDVNGRIALDGFGNPVMEFVSISDRAYVSGANFNYTVLRGRLDTTAQAWTSGAVAWVVPQKNLEEWRTDLLETIAGSPAFFRLVSYTRGAIDTTSTVPECSVNTLPNTSPMYLRGEVTSGLNGTRTAILDLYQWAASVPGTYPSGTSTYTWATGQFTNPATLNGWAAVPPTPVAGQTLYVIRQIYADSNTTPTSSISWTSTYTFPLSSSGLSGSAGQRVGVLEVFQWASSAPALPTGTSVYTWASGSYTLPTVPGSWSLLPGAGAAGQTLYGTAVGIANNNTSPTDSVSWTGGTVYMVGGAGANGSPGSPGSTGQRVAVLEIFQWAASAPAAPSGTSTYTWATAAYTLPTTPGAWSLLPGSGAAGQTLYGTSVAISNNSTAATDSVTWASTPVYTVGGSGTNGSAGQRIGILEVYQWGASAPALPTGTSVYTWATGVFTAPSTPNGWSLLPGAAVAGQTLWATSVVISNNSTGATDTATWSGGSAYAVGFAGTNGSPGNNGVAVLARYDGSYTRSSGSGTTATGLTTGSITVPATINVQLFGTFTNNSGTSSSFAVTVVMDGSTTVAGFNMASVASGGGYSMVALTRSIVVSAGSHTFEVYVNGGFSPISFVGTLTIQ